MTEIIKIEGWKVLLANRDSVSNWNVTKPNPLAIKYPVDVEVFPKKGKLFFFALKIDAENFTKGCQKVREYFKSMPKIIIVKCMATNPQIAKENSLVNSIEDICKFYESTNAGSTNPWVDLIDPPPGTYTADSITCLE